MRRVFAAIVAVVAAGCSGAAGVPQSAGGSAALKTREASLERSVPIVGGCAIFPADNPWNTDISQYPVDPKSAQYIASIPGNLHPDFGHEARYGIPFNVVPASQPAVPVKFLYKSQSDPGPYPIPPDAQIEGGAHSKGDRHVLVLQQGACKLYEMYHAYPKDGGTSWHAGSGAVFPLDTNKLRPNGWTSADAAGLPILPALDQVRRSAGRSRSITRCASRWKTRSRATSIRRRTSPATAATRIFRRWGCAFG